MSSAGERNALLEQIVPESASVQLEIAAALVDDPRPHFRELAPTVTEMALAKLKARRKPAKEATA